MSESERSFVGDSLDDALSRACEVLGVRLGELHYEVLDGTGNGRVTITAAVDPVAIIGLFLAETMRAGNLDVRVRLGLDDEILVGELSGEDASLLTAGGGKGLDSLQYLCNRVMNRRLREHPPVHLDCGGFKDRRAHRLQEQAEEAAAEVDRRRTPVTLGPLTPAARREIHLALADHPGVETESDGGGFLKRVVIRPRRRR